MFAKLRRGLRARTTAPSGSSWLVEFMARMLDDLPPDKPREMKDLIYYQYVRQKGYEPVPALFFARILRLDETHRDTARRWFNALVVRRACDQRLLTTHTALDAAHHALWADWNALYDRLSPEDRETIKAAIDQQTEAAGKIKTLLLMISRDHPALVQTSWMLDDLAGTDHRD